MRISDLALPTRVLERLQRMMDSRRLMNMLFYSKPGTGKTSAARIFINTPWPGRLD